jgi:hypothetical protein
MWIQSRSDLWVLCRAVMTCACLLRAGVEEGARLVVIEACSKLSRQKWRDSSNVRNYTTVVLIGRVLRWRTSGPGAIFARPAKYV